MNQLSLAWDLESLTFHVILVSTDVTSRYIIWFHFGFCRIISYDSAFKSATWSRNLVESHVMYMCIQFPMKKQQQCYKCLGHDPDFFSIKLFVSQKLVLRIFFMDFQVFICYGCYSNTSAFHTKFYRNMIWKYIKQEIWWYSYITKTWKENNIIMFISEKPRFYK